MRENRDCFPLNVGSGLLPLMLLILFFALSGFFSSRILAERTRYRYLETQPADGAPLLLEISRRPPLTLGFRNFLADITWLEAVQVSGNLKMATADYDRLYDLLKITSNFDPKFEIPYLLGSLILGESPSHAWEALRILEYGKAHLPADWRFPFYIGFTRYYSLGDPESAGKSMAEAARIPGSPAFLTGLASRMLSEARKPAAALSMLETIAGQESDPSRKAVLERRIREITVERDLQMLEQAAETYRVRTGSSPAQLEDLVRAGIISEVPKEPNGGKYLLERGGKVRSDRVAQRLRVFRSQ